VRATCPAHLMFLDFTLFGKKYKIWRSYYALYSKLPHKKQVSR
jgi:hypothetical protein